MALRDQAPTPQRLRLARSAGLSAFSPLLTGAALLASFMVYLLSGPGERWVTSILDIARLAWQEAGGSMSEPQGLAQAWNVILNGCRDVLIMALLVALVAHLVQVGPRFSMYGSGAASGFDGAYPTRFGAWCVRVILGVSATLGVILVGIWLHRAGIVDLVYRDRDWALDVASKGLVSFCIVMITAMAIAGVLDLLAQRSALSARLAMTREEVRAERYADGGGGGGGGGGLAYALAGRARDDARAVRVMGLELTAAQTRAHLVIVGGGASCALRYDTQVAPAPVVIASGDGEHGANVRNSAIRGGVELYFDSVLAKRLASLTPGEMIAPESFAQVGEAFGAVKEVYVARGEVAPWEVVP